MPRSIFTSNFVIGTMAGIPIGILIIWFFSLLAKRRSKHRRRIAVNTAVLSRMNLQDLRKLFPQAVYPRWIVFAELEKVGWLNEKMVKVWPLVNQTFEALFHKQAASQLCKESLEPILEYYRPTVLASLKFQKFTLGTIAPQFLGVQMVESPTEGEIAMDVEVQWDGNPSIILAVGTLLGVALPIQVKDFGINGVFRLVFKPLVDQLPCFGAFTYTLINKKRLNFTLKVVGGERSIVPGLFGMLDGMLRTAIMDTVEWPMRQVVPVLSGYDNLPRNLLPKRRNILFHSPEALTTKPIGMLNVRLVQATDLPNKDLVGKSDPFALLYVRPIPSYMKRSRTIGNDLNPVWDEHFELEVEDLDAQKLVIRVLDEEGLQESQLIGVAQVFLKDLQPWVSVEKWLNLMKDLEDTTNIKYRGKNAIQYEHEMQVHVELLFHPQAPDARASVKGKQIMANPQDNATRAPSLDMGAGSSAALLPRTRERRSSIMRNKEIVRGILTVRVERAEALTAADYLGTSDPYASLCMKKNDSTKKKTKIVFQDLNPNWNQEFDFLVEDANHDLLIVEIWDHDTFGRDFLGRVVLTLTRVIEEGQYSDEFKLSGARSGKLHMTLQWTPQHLHI